MRARPTLSVAMLSKSSLYYPSVYAQRGDRTPRRMKKHIRNQLLMKIIAGDDTGLVKAIDLQKKEVYAKFGTQAKENRIIRLISKVLQEITLIFVLRESTIILLDADLNELASCAIQQDPLDFVVTDQADIVLVYRNRLLLQTSYNPQQNTFSQTRKLNKDCFPLLTDATKQVSAVHLHPNQELLGFAYHGCPPNIFNISSQKLHWTARNVKNDELDLQVKMKDFHCYFLDDYSLGVLTVHLTLRIYDIQTAKSQPIAEHKIRHSKSLLAQLQLHENQYYISNSAGEILIYNRDFRLMRKASRNHGSIKEFLVAGRFIFSICSDRFLRIHTLEGALLQKYNLSQRLSALCLIAEERPEEMEIEEVQEEKQLWTIKNGKEAKARFAGMRKNTIKLPYLEQMFENQRLRKLKEREMKVKSEQKERVAVKKEEDGALNQEGKDTGKVRALLLQKKIQKKQRIAMLKKKQLTNRKK